MSNSPERPELYFPRILHGSFMAAILVYVGLLVYMQVTGVIADIYEGDPVPDYIVAVLSVLAGGALAGGLALGRWAAERARQRRGSQSTALAVHLIRSALFESVAIFGLVLRILGVGWEVCAPFFVAAFALMVLTFPTKERWDRLSGRG